MTEHKKPNLSPVRGLFLRPDYLPDILRDELVLHLKGSPLSDEQKELLLRYCNDLAQLPADTTPGEFASRSIALRKKAICFVGVS